MRDLVKYFTGVIKNNKLSHLYLISGEPGSYKLSEVLEVCYTIFKEFRETDNLYNQVIKIEHPNLFFIEKDESRTVIRKEDITKLQQEFSKTALIEGPRIFIINQVETISQEAANSLLKFLEEPESKNTTGFLITDNIDQVISTIRSRSQIIQVKNIDEKEVIEKLIEEGYEIGEASIAVMIYPDTISAGKIIKEGLSSIYQERINFFFETLINSNRGIYVPLDQSNLFYFTNINDFRNYITIMLKSLLDLVRIKNGLSPHYIFWEDKLGELSNKLDFQKILISIELLQEYLQLSVSSVNLELLKDNFLIQLERIVIGHV